MDDKIIDYHKMIKNVDMMINALEYDAMRSGGKVKLNAVTLNELYVFRKNIEAKLPKPAPVKKQPVKEG